MTTWTINNKLVESLHIGNKEVMSIVATDGTVLYEKQSGSIATTIACSFSMAEPITIDENIATITLMDAQNNALSNQTLIATYDDVEYTLTTDTNGLATLDVSNSIKGTHQLLITFEGTDEYAASSASFNVVVAITNTTLTVPNKQYSKSASNKTLQGLLKDAYGNPIVDKWISFSFSNKTYKEKTNASGLAIVSITMSTAGTYTVTAKFAGDDTYKAVTKTATLKIT